MESTKTNRFNGFIEEAVKTAMIHFR